MSKTKQRTHSKREHLDGLVKQLKSENRQLRRRLKELERKSHFYEEVVDEGVEDVQIKHTCFHCGKGELQEFDFGVRVVVKCNNSECNYQTSRKPRK